MKALSLVAFFLLPAAFADEAAKFDFVEPVRILKADYYWDGDRHGGSVSVALQDAAEKLRYVFYKTKDAGPARDGGKLFYRKEKGEKVEPFPNGSDDEKRLLDILRAACLETFGTSDLGDLKHARGTNRMENGFSQMAMRNLLRHFPLKPEAVAHD